MTNLQGYRRKQGFSLIELLVSLFIAGILFASLFAFVYQFGTFFQTVIQENEKKTPTGDFLSFLRNDLRHTNAVNLRKNARGYLLTYLVGRVRNKDNKLEGKEVRLLYNKRKNQLALTEQWFRWSYLDYIEDSLKKRAAFTSLEKTWQIRKENELNFTLLYDGGQREVPLAMRVEVKKIRKDLPPVVETFLLRLGQI